MNHNGLLIVIIIIQFSCQILYYLIYVLFGGEAGAKGSKRWNPTKRSRRTTEGNCWRTWGWERWMVSECCGGGVVVLSSQQVGGKGLSTHHDYVARPGNVIGLTFRHPHPPNRPRSFACHDVLSLLPPLIIAFSSPPSWSFSRLFTFFFNFIKCIKFTSLLFPIFPLIFIFWIVELAFSEWFISEIYSKYRPPTTPGVSGDLLKLFCCLLHMGETVDADPTTTWSKIYIIAIWIGLSLVNSK